MWYIMLIKNNFGTVEYVCTKLKDDTNIFGEMQVVLSGDFYQLPPINDELIGDYGKYCFPLASWIGQFNQKLYKKQRESRICKKGLTNITDNAYESCEKLEKKL